MSDEKKAKETKPAREAQPSAPQAQQTHHRKLTRLNLEEVKKALESVRTQMGGDYSAYAKSLLQQKALLEAQSHPKTGRKAA